MMTVPQKLAEWKHHGDRLSKELQSEGYYAQADQLQTTLDGLDLQWGIEYGLNYFRFKVQAITTNDQFLTKEGIVNDL